MQVGRNDPCPCGSGKKYKKCCLAKDEAAARQGYAQRAEAQRELSQVFGEQFPKLSPGLPPLPAPTPLEQARDELWGAFEAADNADVPALFGRLVADERFDDELAFEMICAIRDHHDSSAFDEAIGALRAKRPELYEHDAPYYLDWEITDALVAGNHAALPGLALAIAARAGKDLDTFYLALDRLCYHGWLALAAQMMREAWPHLGEDAQLVPWGNDEFAQRAFDLTLFAHIERDPNLRADDPTLLAALELFAPVPREGLAAMLALLSGRDERAWSLDDFAFRRAQHGRRGENEIVEDPAVAQLHDLGFAFIGVLHREHGVSLAKGDMARRALVEYILDRHAGELDARKFGRMTRPKGQKPPRSERTLPPPPLCPDRATLDRFVAQMFDILSSRYYDAAALLELTPAWIRFLETCGLLAPEQRAAALGDLRKLVSDAAPLWGKKKESSIVGENIRWAWEDS
jgi:hypothetical protein